jgi:hypothetical protein
MVMFRSILIYQNGLYSAIPGRHRSLVLLRASSGHAPETARTAAGFADIARQNAVSRVKLQPQVLQENPII